MNRILFSLSLLLWAPVHADNVHTPQMKQLLSYIKNIQVSGFEKRYATAQITQEEHAELVQTAHQIQEGLHKQLHTLNQNNQTMSISSMAIGAGQLYLAALGATGATVTTANYANIIVKNWGMPITLLNDYQTQLEKFAESITNYVFTRKPLILGAVVWLPGDMFIETNDFNENVKLFTALCLIPTALATYLAYVCTTSGIKNIKIGFNYKKYLETRLRNVDTIITLLESPHMEK